MHGRLQLADDIVLIFRQIDTGNESTACRRRLDQQIGNLMAHLVARLDQCETAREYQAAQHECNRTIREIGDDAIHRNLDLE